MNSSFALFEERGSGSPLLRDLYQFLRGLAQSDGRKERGSHLARLEFEKRLRMQSPETLADLGTIGDRESLGDLIKSYFEYFGEKMCCFEDLMPYVYEPLLGNGEMTDVMEHLKRYLSHVCLLSAPEMVTSQRSHCPCRFLLRLLSREHFRALKFTAL
jgi:hypothetical protein